ncbi:MAG: DUF2202 domain-containing protein [Desulfurococcales archaeon]|nr:DUF2202 domain-containing protein [Desulfurococcales archaeon]MCE4626901.1 DUF2202 domain-containing protein [Desulfurococcales archaeon]
MRYIGLVAVAIIALLGAAVYMSLGTYNQTSIETTTTSQVTTTTTTTTTATSTSLSQEEIDAILFMREEEKLARDVYLTLYDMWGLQIFSNIADSEQKHMDSVLTLINNYGLEDPAVDEIGVFTNPEIQELYNQLIERGSQSLEEALLVGALIEEKDIIDINNYLEITNNSDIITVFENLKTGSIHHLKAFTSTYESMTGETYQPQLLSVEEYQQLIQTSGPGRGPAYP